jgi:hypothetical protein
VVEEDRSVRVVLCIVDRPLFMAGLFWLDNLGVLRLSTQNALAASILVLKPSSFICQIYLFRRGNIK